MDIPIKDVSLEYARYAQQVGFLQNVKNRILETNISGETARKGAAATLMAFSVIGMTVFTLDAIKENNKEKIAASLEKRTSSGLVEMKKPTVTAMAQQAPKETFIHSTPDSTETVTPQSFRLEGTESFKDKLKQIATFKLPEDLKVNNYPKAIAEMQLNKGEYYLALVSMAEGFSPTIKPDNKGYFIGFGWNLTLNSMEENERIAKSIGMKSDHVEIVKNMSHQSKVDVTFAEMQSVKITPQQGMQAAYIIGDNILKNNVITGIQNVLVKHRNKTPEEAHLTAVDAFNALDKHQQALVVYHGYKTGGSGFQKFKNLILNIVDFAQEHEKMDKIEKMHAKKMIVGELNYSYSLKGRKVLDTRATKITSAMFLSPHTFASEMGLNINPDKPTSKPIKVKYELKM